VVVSCHIIWCWNILYNHHIMWCLNIHYNRMVIILTLDMWLWQFVCKISLALIRCSLCFGVAQRRIFANKFSPDLCIFIVWNFCHFASFCKILLEHEDVYDPVLRANFYESQTCYSEKNSYLFSHIVLHVVCWTFICVIHVPF